MKGAFFAIKHALRPMIAAKSGAICVVCSDQSTIGKPEQNLYGLTKGALASLVRSCGAQARAVPLAHACPRARCKRHARRAVRSARHSRQRRVPRHHRHPALARRRRAGKATRARSDRAQRPDARARAQIVAWKGTGSVDETLEWLKTAQPVPGMGEPAEAAQAVLATLTNGFMAGALVAVDGGYTCV